MTMTSPLTPPCGTAACGDDTRRKTAIQNKVNGIDYVDATVSQNGGEGQKSSGTINVHFWLPPPHETESKHWQLIGGRKHLEVTNLNLKRSDKAITITVVDVQAHQRYRLSLVDLDAAGCRTHRPFAGFDPRFSTIEFEFSPQQATETDPLEAPCDPQPTLTEPTVNYLAKDYQSFRQLILDRLATIMPDWQDRSAADLQMVLIELLAYTGDRLSYFQDAVATEAYLGTARRRISVRRHARLVDYRVHEGCNARAFLHIPSDPGIEFAPQDVYFTTRLNGRQPIEQTALREDQLREDALDGVEVFEPVLLPPRNPNFTCTDVKHGENFITRLLEIINESNILPDHVGNEIISTLSDAMVQHSLPVSESVINACVKALNAGLNGTQLWNGPALKPCRPQVRAAVCRLLSQGKQAACNRTILDELLAGVVSNSGLDGQIRLYPAHNKIQFYTWGECEYWLSKGATSATLCDEPISNVGSSCEPDSGEGLTPVADERRLRYLSRGDLLLFEEVRGPQTGRPEDADTSHRQVVRLTRVFQRTDPVTNQRIVEIEWSRADALRFPLCIRSRKGPSAGQGQCEYVDDVSVARGNVILVDHGHTQPLQNLGTVDSDDMQVDCGTECEPPKRVTRVIPFEPQLETADLTHRQLLSNEVSAVDLLKQQPHKATPAVVVRNIPATPRAETLPLEPVDLDGSNYKQFVAKYQSLSVKQRYVIEDLLDAHYAALLERTNRVRSKLTGLGNPPTNGELQQIAHQAEERTTWLPQYDLITSQTTDRHFVVEIDNERVAHLRFGDGQLGQAVEPGQRFSATYRVGNGRAGNVGANQIQHMIFRRNLAFGPHNLRNPLPAEGGQDAQTLTEVRLQAPYTYQRQQQRAVLAQDYADIVLREFADRVQDAKASITWEGTYFLVRVVIDAQQHVRESSVVFMQDGTETINGVKKLCNEIRKTLERYRRMWHEVVVEEGVPVPIELSLVACVRAGYPRGDVRRELMELFSNREFANGRRGLFHPDKLTFGQPVITSALITAARKIDGVENIDVIKLQRQGRAETNVADDETISNNGTGILTVGPLEIVALDNNGSNPTTGGKFCLELRGGR